MSRNKLYILLLVACLIGFSYLFYHLQHSESIQYSVCLFKNGTGYPCPSCGTTRAMELIFQGKIMESLLLNPFGILVSLIMTVAPLWILMDFIFKKETFYLCYKKAEKTIRIKWIAILLVALVLMNWIWNIYKNL